MIKYAVVKTIGLLAKLDTFNSTAKRYFYGLPFTLLFDSNRKLADN